MTALPTKRFVTPDEYLAAEKNSLEKNEYLNGEVFQMAGASQRHNLITANLIISFGNELRDRKCYVYPSDMRVYVPKSGFFTYPDVTVACDKAEFLTDGFHETLTNPILIVEVLSPTTAEYDRGPKFDHYKTIESLKEYVLVWQEKKRVARYTKRDDSNWMLTDFIGGDAIIELTSIKCVLTMEDIYAKVVFEEDSGE